MDTLRDIFSRPPVGIALLFGILAARSYLRGDPSTAPVITPIVAGLIVLILFSLFFLSRPAARKTSRLAWDHVRALAYALFLGTLTTSVLYAIFGNTETKTEWIMVFWTASLLGAFLAQTRAPPFVGLLFTNLIVLVVLAELIVIAAARIFPSPILWDPASSRSFLRAFQYAPGSLRFGVPHNSMGYYDKEFVTGSDNRTVIAVISDSFGEGIVPYEQNFTTVAERALRRRLPGNRIFLHNFGVPAAGPREYAYIYSQHVKRFSPRLVVIALFVGNDLSDLFTMPRTLFLLQDWRISQVITRIFRATTGAASLTEPLFSSISEDTFEDETIPNMTDQDFLALELDRLTIAQNGQVQNRGVDQLYQKLFKILRWFSAQLDDRLILMLIPDEFQINDELYRTLLVNTKKPEKYDRDAPQRRISEYARKHNIPVLDLLPVLRDARGACRPYRPRDSHWNACGNKVAGQALADFLAPRIERKEIEVKRAAD